MELFYFTEILCDETSAHRTVVVPVGGGTVRPSGTHPGDGMCGLPEFDGDKVAALMRGETVVHKGRRYYDHKRAPVRPW